LVENPQKHPISEETPTLIDKMLRERESLAGMARVTGVSARWLPDYVNDKYENIPKQVQVSKNRKGRLTIECEELWSLVGNQDNQWWIGLARDRDTGEIVGVATGDRSSKTAQQLWDSLPAVYRQCAVS
jgi:insertion element IS1 protein InsB